MNAFLASLSNNSNIVFCILLAKEEYLQWNRDIITATNRLHRRGTFVVLDKNLGEIRVQNGVNAWNQIEIATLDAVNTAVNLAYAEYQVGLEEERRRGEQNQRRSVAPSNGIDQQSRSLKGKSLIPSLGNISVTSHTAKAPLHHRRTLQHPPRKMTPPPPPPHLSPKHQQEMNLLDFSDPETPKSLHAFFQDDQVLRHHGIEPNTTNSHNHINHQSHVQFNTQQFQPNRSNQNATNNIPKQPHRSKSSDISFDEIFASFAENRHEAHVKHFHQSSKSTNNVLEHFNKSPPRRTVPSPTVQPQHNTILPTSPSSSSSSPSPESPVVSPAPHDSSTNGAPHIRRRVNYPRKSDLELMKTIHRAQMVLTDSAQQYNGGSETTTTSKPLPVPPQRPQPETFEINESEILDFDFDTGDEEEVDNNSGELTKQESFEDLTRELDDMLAQIVVQTREHTKAVPISTKQLQPATRVNPITGSPVLLAPPSSESPPALPQSSSGTSPILTLNQKLGKIIHEIFKEEDTFVRSLEILQQTFVGPLKQQNIISESLHHLVFSDFPVIYNIHQPMVVHMQKLFDATSPEQKSSLYPEYSEAFLGNFIRIIQNKAPAFKLYTRFFSQMSNMLISLKEEQEQNDAFREFLTSAQTKLRQENAARQTLTSYLQQILQHLARYPLILQRLFDNAPPTATYRDDLHALNEQIKATLRHCNQRKSDEDMQDLIFDLEKELNMQLQKRGRRLMKHGVITRTKPTKRYSVHLYLFNDLIIMKDLRKGISRQPPKVLKIHHNLRVGKLNAVSFFIFDCFFQKNQALTLFFECEKEAQCEEWVRVATGIIKNRKRLIKLKVKNSDEEEKTE